MFSPLFFAAASAACLVRQRCSSWSSLALRLALTSSVNARASTVGKGQTVMDAPSLLLE